MTFRPLSKNLDLLELLILILTQVHKQICHLWTPGSSHHHLYLFSCNSHLQTSVGSKTLEEVSSVLCWCLPPGHCVPRGVGLIFFQSICASEHQAGVGLQRTMGEPFTPGSVTATGPGPALNRPEVPRSLSWERIYQLLLFTLRTVMFQTQTQGLWAYASGAEVLDVLYGPVCTLTLFLPCLCFLYPTMKTCYLLPLSSPSFACASRSHHSLSCQEFKDTAFFPWQVSFHPQHFMDGF